MLLFQEFLRKILPLRGIGTSICYSSPHLRLDSSLLPLQRSGISWLIQTNWNSVLVGLSHCYTEGSNQEERHNGYNTGLHETFWNAVDFIFCRVNTSLEELFLYRILVLKMESFTCLDRSWEILHYKFCVCYCFPPPLPLFSIWCLITNETS